MYVDVKNENYGYQVATYGDYVVVTNPPSLRWTPLTASSYHTGTVDYFKYNKNTDEHDFVGTLTKEWELTRIPLITEDNNALPTGPNFNIVTESGSLLASSSLWYASASLLLDYNDYTASYEDGFGTSVDMYQKMLVIGAPYFKQIIATHAVSFSLSGSAVEVHDLSKTEFVPRSQSCFVTLFDNPDPNVSESFGRAVSINNSWIAVGSPYVSQSRGMVYVYQNQSVGNQYSWSLFQKLEVSATVPEAQFGTTLKLNKSDGTLSQSMVVGCGNLVNNEAYYFEFISGSWQQTFVFHPTTDIYPLTIGNFPPYNPIIHAPSGTSGFGAAVSTYDNSVIIGSWSDRSVYEFSGSTLYQQGSAYIFEKCDGVPTNFKMVFKTYGTPLTLKNNRMGYAVDIAKDSAIVGIPKIDNLGIISCYVQGTLDQLHQCTSDLENTLTGQAMLLQRNTSSGEWGITNVYQRKKQYLNPYRSFGNSVAIDERSMVVGAPMLFIDQNRIVNLNVTSSSGVVLGDITGKSYIYNMANLRDEFHVGNVFYRNGKVVIMTSGSMFDGLFFNKLNSNTYEYDLQFKGQHTIFEKQVVCSVNPGEFNISTNPTAIHRLTSSFSLNSNGRFDFQDMDVVMRYMQYKNTSILGLPVSTDWSSSIIVTDDEKSLYDFYVTQGGYNAEETSIMASESILRWEFTDTWVQNVLDLNQDNKIDIRDMNIMWKYFSNRLTQENYATYITPSCNRKQFSDVIDYMDNLTQRHAVPEINHGFLDYERNVALDKTGSFLAPLATTIGIYDGLDLVAVAKLGNPIKITPELPFNFVVKLDY